MAKLYRNKYLIGLYDEEDCDTLVALVDNTKEYAELMEINSNTATQNLFCYFHGYVKNRIHYTGNKLPRYKGKYLSVYFIRNDEE